MIANALSTGALAGLRVVEMGQLIAGPFVGKTLGDFGADVIKIEAPAAATRCVAGGWSGRHPRSGGRCSRATSAPSRSTCAPKARTSPGSSSPRPTCWSRTSAPARWKAGAWLGRSAKAQPRPRDAAHLGLWADRAVQRPPRLRHDRRSHGRPAPPTGEPGRVPVRCGISIGDTLAALHGVIGADGALPPQVNGGRAGHRRGPARGRLQRDGSLIPSTAPLAPCESRRLGLPGIAPSNAYPCSDGVVLVAGNGDSIFKRLMTAIGREDLGQDPQLATNAGRAARGRDRRRHRRLDSTPRGRGRAVCAGSRQRAGRQGLHRADIAADPHYQARDMLLQQRTRDGFDVMVPGVVPKLLAPRPVAHPGAALG